MNSKEYWGLMEAYAEVYAPEQLDESNKENKQKKNDAISKIIQKKLHPSVLPSLTYGRRELKKEELDIFDVVLEFLQVEGFAETLEQAEWMMANMIDEEAIGIILGEGNPIGRFLSNRKHKLRDTKKGHEDIMRRNREYQTKGKGPGGYRNKGAGRVEKVREDYVNEAQHARENPEKYEREQEKKSAPVRGERTPMPPRGDKRREDFEKWYAKQMGR